MSFSDNLENNLKRLESSADPEPATATRHERQKQSQRAHVIAAAPHAERLRSGKFTSGLLTHSTRIGHGLRTKVNIIWLCPMLRLEARDHRLELRPAPEGVMAHFLVGGKEIKKQKVDLNGNPEQLAKEWLDTVGPRPAPEPDLDSD